MKTSINVTRVAQIVAIALFLSGCGSSIQPKKTESASVVPDLGGIPTESGEVGTQCNGFNSNDARMSGKVTTYYSGGQLQEDKMRLRLTSIEAAFETSSNYHVKFFRWQVSSTGLVNIDSTPVEFIIEKGTTNTTPISNRMSSISLDEIVALRGAAGVTGTTATDFFGGTVLVLQNVGFEWQAMKAVIYNGTQIVGQADFLLPIFAANPNRYAATHVGVLPAMHPFITQKNQILSDSDWAAKFSSYCF